MSADSFLPVILRDCAAILFPAVRQKFHLVTKNCSWPSLWKLLYSTPLHISLPFKLVENYRPTSIVCKIFLVFEIRFNLFIQKQSL